MNDVLIKGTDMLSGKTMHLYREKMTIYKQRREAPAEISLANTLTSKLLASELLFKPLSVVFCCGALANRYRVA